MAFFNLWSSERLSFSLSIVAVVSAAITTYHQFYNHKTSVSYVNTTVHVNSASFETNAFDDSLTTQLTFMNDGSTPVSIIKSRLYLLNHYDQIGNGSIEKQRLLGGSIDGVIFQDECQSKESCYLESKSVSTLTFRSTIDSTSLMALLRAVPSSERTNDMSSLELGVYVLMVDPYGNFSSQAISIAEPSYDSNGTHLVESLPLNHGRMPPFVTWDALMSKDIELQDELKAPKEKCLP